GALAFVIETMVARSGSARRRLTGEGDAKVPYESARATVRAQGLEDDPDDNRADDGDDGRGDESGPALEAELARQPAADDRPENADDDVGQAAAGRSSADDGAGQGTGDEPEDDPVHEVGHGRQSATSRSARKA